MLKLKKSVKISVIIPIKPKDKAEATIDTLKKVDYPSGLIEIFLAYGFNPSRQRNMAVRKARGEILYFLDNDSQIEKRAFKRAVATLSGKASPLKIPQARGFSFFPNWLSQLIMEKFFAGQVYQGKIGVVGGPNIWWQKEPFWASMTGAILESFFAHSKMAARYRPIGPVHRASEKELILCNLAVRRDVFREVSGFNEALFPNEENELLNRIKKAGYQLVYHPGILVFRPRRETFKALLNAFFHYGRGRMEQIRIEGAWQSLPLLAPLIFLFYLLSLFVYHFWFAFLPALLYFSLSFGSALGCALRRKKLYLVIFLPLLFCVAHLSYAFGQLWGLTTDLERRRKTRGRRKIKIVKWKSFEENWPPFWSISR